MSEVAVQRENPLLDAALHYASRGWPVFPCHTASGGACSCPSREACDRPGKHPRTKNGFIGASVDAQRIREWWTTWPDAGVCIRTGNGLFVLDIDPKHGGDEALSALEKEHGPLPQTVECITGGGGRHIFFKYAGRVACSVSLIAPGIDVRADGGYVVAAPSLHASGGRYTWEVAHHPADTAIADLPEWLAKLASPSKNEPTASPAPEPTADRFIEGGRNRALMSLAGTMRRRGMAPTAIEAALLAENAAKCRPPLSKAEVQRVAHSVTRYAPGDVGPAAFAFERGDHLELAEATIARLETGPLTHDEGQFWRYSPATGVWHTLEHEEVAAVATSFAGEPIGDRGSQVRITDSTLKGAVAIARILLLTRTNRLTFARAKPAVAFRNGLAVVGDERVRLLPHDPAHMCRHGFPFDYDEDAPRTRLNAFLDALFADVPTVEQVGRKMLLQEFVGACLTGSATKYQKLLLISGGGGNGKSEFLRLVRSLFPKAAVASLAPQDWAERFKPARLVGVLANFVDEIPEREITSGEVFKSIVTGDPVTTERKNRDPFEFRPVAGHIFSANTLPGTVDQSDGFWRRLVVCPFTRDFTKSTERRLDAATEVLEHEMPGLAAWALEGAARLDWTGKYTSVESAERVLAEWREEADPVRRFVAERSGPPEIGASALYREWREWARANGFADMSSTRFGRRVMATGKFNRKDAKGGRVYTRLSA